MIKEKQISFYAALGDLLTSLRKNRNMTLAQLATRSGEQFNTIQSIEQGKPCFAHHFLWMGEIFGIDTLAVMNHMEGMSGKQEEKTISFGNGSYIKISTKQDEGINWSYVPKEFLNFY